ncbi:MAG: 4-(cytidine 5'-diphospho)-2-C-methyl-D-erythritol kinase [Flavobacteriia bacterium]
MILYPPAKINLGLNILRKREDAYHDIDTCMVEIPFTDILEVTKADYFEFLQTGIIISGAGGPNLCEKAYDLLKNEFNIGPVRIHLRKQIPVGAGLGGGSADATYTLLALNELFHLELSHLKLKQLASQLGSDCPFFVEGLPQIAQGRGEILSPVELDLNNVFLVLLNPGIHVGTKEAYDGVSVSEDVIAVEEIIQKPLGQWRAILKNDFESSVFQLFPQIQQLKDSLYQAGAVYAAMSGSGSSVYGLFLDESLALTFKSTHLIYIGKFINPS